MENKMAKQIKKEYKFSGSTTISLNLNALVYNNYTEKINIEREGEGINFYDLSMESLYGIVMTVNIWEAILNEVFQNDFMRMSDSIFSDAREAIEKWDIKTKTITYPRLLLGKNIYDKSSEIWNAFQRILEIRNSIVHYKFSLDEGPKKALDFFRQKGLTVERFRETSDGVTEVGMPWTMELSTSEVLRYSRNTIAKMTKILRDELESYPSRLVGIPFDFLYKEITEKDVHDIMKQKGIPLDRKNFWFMQQEQKE